MMTKRIFFGLTLLGMLMTGCTDRDDDISGVQIRIRNTSEVTYDRVAVGGGGAIYEDVAPNAYSDYLAYETAYRYAYVNIEAGGETYVLQPIDFVGEEPLSLGFYTYELGLDGDGGVTLDFVVD